jgi:hypothetical protein
VTAYSLQERGPLVHELVDLLDLAQRALDLRHVGWGAGMEAPLVGDVTLKAGLLCGQVNELEAHLRRRGDPVELCLPQRVKAAGVRPLVLLLDGGEVDVDSSLDRVVDIRDGDEVAAVHVVAAEEREAGRRRDGETERRRDGETERRRDGETGRRRDGEAGCVWWWWWRVPAVEVENCKGLMETPVRWRSRDSARDGRGGGQKVLLSWWGGERESKVQVKQQKSHAARQLLSPHEPQFSLNRNLKVSEDLTKYLLYPYISCVVGKIFIRNTTVQSWLSCIAVSPEIY